MPGVTRPPRSRAPARRARGAAARGAGRSAPLRLALAGLAVVARRRQQVAGAEHDAGDGADEQEQRDRPRRRAGSRSGTAGRWSAGEPNESAHRAPARRAAPLESLTAITISMKIASAGDAPRRPAPMPPRLQVELARSPEVGDHEQEHDHHGAGVDEQLRDGDEVALQHEVQRRQRGQVQDQRERGQERVALHDDGDRRADRAAAPAT